MLRRPPPYSPEGPFFAESASSGRTPRWKETLMQASDHSVAKAQMERAMLQGCSWREAVQGAGVQMSRTTAYRLRQRMRAGGEEAVQDRGQGLHARDMGRYA